MTLALALFAGCNQDPEQKKSLKPLIHTAGAVYKEGPIKGKMIDAGFLYGDSAYHGITQASDGYVYYVICSHHIDSSACMFKYNTESGEVTMIANLTEMLGENGSKVFPQGKVHSKIYEHEGKL